MKPSKYNIIIKKPNFTYWFNTLSRNFFRLSPGLSSKIEAALKNGLYHELPESMLQKLKEGGFAVDKDLDELEIVRDKNRKAIADKNYFLVLLPTLNCNYHCWYCIQDHISSKMTDETMLKVKRHIDYMIEKEKIESLHLDWFGGEPFMYFKEIVIPISRYAQEKCRQTGIPFYCSSTTNGYYLTKETIAECVKLDFIQFQITLDGNKEFHDKVKFQKGCDSTFMHVLSNINNLLAESDGIRVYLRINYTHKNISESIVEEVNSCIEPANRQKIIVTPRKVWQEDIDKNFFKNVRGILDKFWASGYNVEYWNVINNDIPCYTNKKYYNAINFNGNVVKCTACNDLYEPPKGILSDDGVVKWSDGMEERYTAPTFENERCFGCNKLPLCMGLCPRDHIAGSKHCKEDVYDESFEDSIVNLIDRSFQEVTL